MIKWSKALSFLAVITRCSVPAQIRSFLVGHMRPSLPAATLLALTIATQAYADMSAPPSFDHTPAFPLTLAGVFFACAISTAGIWFLRRRAGKAPLAGRLLLSSAVVFSIVSFLCLGAGLPRYFFEKAISSTTAKKWPKAYTATFECSMPRGPKPEVTVYKQYSNGQGLLRRDFQDGSNDRVVFDFVRQQSMYTAASTKTYGINTIFAPPPFDQASALAADWEPRDARNIDGHPCHGWLQVGSGSDKWTNTETWIGDDTQCEVESTTKRIQSIEQTTKLKAYKAENPDPVLFQPPQGYTLKK
jgi:hypothetical protein